MDNSTALALKRLQLLVVEKCSQALLGTGSKPKVSKISGLRIRVRCSRDQQPGATDKKAKAPQTELSPLLRASISSPSIALRTATRACHSAACVKRLPSGKQSPAANTSGLEVCNLRQRVLIHRPIYQSGKMCLQRYRRAPTFCAFNVQGRGTRH